MIVSHQVSYKKNMISEVITIERSIPYSRRSIKRDWNSGEDDHLHGTKRTYQSGGYYTAE